MFSLFGALKQQLLPSAIYLLLLLLLLPSCLKPAALTCATIISTTRGTNISPLQQGAFKNSAVFKKMLLVFSNNILRRTKRGALSENLPADALCKRTRRDINAVKTILRRNARFFRHEMRIENGFYLDTAQHEKLAQSNPELSVEATIEFLEDFEQFLLVHARRHRRTMHPSELRSLVLKTRNVHRELGELLKLQRPSYVRRWPQNIEHLERSNSSRNMASHVNALLTDVSRSVALLCSGVTSSKAPSRFAFKIR